jgi:hypothetical protein
MERNVATWCPSLKGTRGESLDGNHLPGILPKGSKHRNPADGGRSPKGVSVPADDGPILIERRVVGVGFGLGGIKLGGARLP